MLNFILEYVNQFRHRRYERAQEKIDYDGQVRRENMRNDEREIYYDVLEREEEAYMQEVDHGWDNAWADHYLGDGP